MEIPEIHVADENNVLKKYSDPIDLSNACRAFYQSRLEMTKTLKAQWKLSVVGCADGHPTKELKKRPTRKESLDCAIQKLKHEMACLMEQDLYLMKQMLTLNEEIEDLKWRRRHVWGASASSFYSSDMIQSTASIGRLDEQTPLKYSPPSSLSLQLDAVPTRFSVYNDDDPYGTFNRRTMSYKNYLANRKSIGRAPPFVLASVPNSGKASPVADDLSKQRTLAELDSKDVSNSSPVEIKEMFGFEPKTRRRCADESLSHESDDRTVATSSGLGECDSVSSISDNRSTERFTGTRKTGKMLQLAMHSQDSGIHDCNGNSL